MMARCIDCKHFDMRAHAAFAKLGLGRCKVADFAPATFVTAGYARQCEKFDAAPEEVSAKRIKFLEHSEVTK